MTGREIIIYILNNHLEDKTILKNGVLVCFMDETEAAVNYNVGVETIRAWYSLGMLKGINVGDSIFFLRDAPDPRERK